MVVKTEDFLKAADDAVAKLSEAEVRQTLAHLLGDFWRMEEVDESYYEIQDEEEDDCDNSLTFAMADCDFAQDVAGDIQSAGLPTSYFEFIGVKEKA